MSFETIHIDNPQFTDDLWAQFFELRRQMSDRYQMPMVASTMETLKHQLIELVRSAEKNYYFVILENDSPVGWVMLRIDNDAQSQPLANMFSDHVFESLPDGFPSVVASELMRIMDEINCGKIISEAIHARATMLCESLGGQKTGHMDRYRLYRAKANHQTINDWLESFPRKYPDLKVELFEEIPEQYADAYIRLMNQFIEDIPAEHAAPIAQLSLATIRARETARRRRGMHFYTVALIDQSDQLLGHSSASIFEENPTGAYQSMTGVERTFRGRGLSRWLKAELFTRLGELHPRNEYLNVDLRAINKPILAVNQAMGYELFFRGYEYLLERDTLRRPV